MKTYKLLLLTIFIISCTEDEIKPSFYVHPDLRPYYEMFLEHSHNNNKELIIPKSFTIEFDENLNGTAVCRHKDNYQQILIHPSWYNDHEYKKIYVLFHELGHCLLGRTHTWNNMSIMYSTPVDGIKSGLYNFAIHSNRQIMIDELFD